MNTDAKRTTVAAAPGNLAAYQQLISSALATDRATALVSLLPVIAGDHSLSYEARVRLLQVACSVAATSPQPLADIGKTPLRRTLLVFQPWFGFEFDRLIRAAHEQGHLLALFSGFRVSGRRKFSDLAPHNFRSFQHGGVRLWDLSSYRLSTQLRCLPEQIDPQTPTVMNVIRQVYGEAADLLDEARLFIRFYRPESVIYAQGYDLIAAVVRQVAVEAGVRVVALENVCVRDRLGWDDVSGIAVNSHGARSYYLRFREHVSHEAAKGSVQTYFTSIDRNKLTEHLSGSSTDLVQFHGKTVLFLGQVSTDAAILFGRRGEFRSQIESMVACARYAERAGSRLVIKLHPKESPSNPQPEPNFRALTAEWLAGHSEFTRLRTALGERLIVDTENTLNTFGLIKQADVCVTTNSQAGLEALALGKEVLLCGNAFYGGLGFTHEAWSPNDLERFLDAVLDQGIRLNVDAQAQVFFHIFTQYFCLPKAESSVVALAAGRPVFPRTDLVASESPHSQAA